jgi:hypothetical protein
MQVAYRDWKNGTRNTSGRLPAQLPATVLREIEMNLNPLRAFSVRRLTGLYSKTQAVSGRIS